MPLIVFGMPVLDGMEPDPEYCGMCGNTQVVVVYVRIDQALISICDDCVGALAKAMDHVKATRKKYLGDPQ